MLSIYPSIYPTGSTSISFIPRNNRRPSIPSSALVPTRFHSNFRIAVFAIFLLHSKTRSILRVYIYIWYMHIRFCSFVIFTLVFQIREWNHFLSYAATFMVVRRLVSEWARTKGRREGGRCCDVFDGNAGCIVIYGEKDRAERSTTRF